jgi:hypothetical protein
MRARAECDEISESPLTNFYEKALFVKPTWRPRCVVNATALCPSRYVWATPRIGLTQLFTGPKKVPWE